MKKIFTLYTIVLSAVIILASCTELTLSPPDIKIVKERHESDLMDLPGVVGIGIGECDGKPCIKVLVEQVSAALERQLPKQLEGFPVEIEASGAIQAQPQELPSPEPSTTPTPTPSN